MRAHFRTPLFVALAAAALVLATAVLLIAVLTPEKQEEQTAATSPIGGPFRLTTQDGAPLSSDDLLGKPFAIFFGFTHCPEVCPTTLWDMSKALERLGPDSDKVRVLFVSLDPRRDTPTVIHDYLTAFDPRIVGLTGSEADIAALAKAYRVYWRQIPLDAGDYTLDHTAAVYLMDAAGQFVGIIGYQEQPDRRDALLKQLVAASPGP